MNKTTLLYYFFLAVSAVVLETTSAAASASLLGDKKLQQNSVLTDNLKLLNVAGDDGRTSPPPTFLAKASSFLSKKFKNLGGGGVGTHDHESDFSARHLNQGQCGSCWAFSTTGTQTGTSDFIIAMKRQRMIEEGDDTANTSSTDAEITGFVTITGYKDGIDPYTGEKNNTLEVRYNLNGCNGECFVFEVEDNPNFCDEVAIGELDGDNSEGDVDIIKDISTIITDDVVEYINVNTSVSTFFGRPIVVQGPKERVLACAMFKEITSNYTDVSAEAEGAPMDDKNMSGAISSASVTVWVSLVSSIVVITALF